MSYRKTNNSFSNWKVYCEENHELLVNLKFPSKVFEKETNFIDFMTSGQINQENNFLIDFDKIEDELFWELFTFINNYFDFDSINFTKFEKSRIKRGV